MLCFTYTLPNVQIYSPNLFLNYYIFILLRYISIALTKLRFSSVSRIILKCQIFFYIENHVATSKQHLYLFTQYFSKIYNTKNYCHGLEHICGYSEEGRENAKDITLYIQERSGECR